VGRQLHKLFQVLIDPAARARADQSEAALAQRLEDIRGRL
jgi:hypothetical protein